MMAFLCMNVMTAVPKKVPKKSQIVPKKSRRKGMYSILEHMVKQFFLSLKSVKSRDFTFNTHL